MPDEQLPEFSRAEMLDQLGRACEIRSAEDQVLWSVFGAFWAANTVLLVALFATGKPPESHYVGIVISVVGSFLSVAWHIVQQRSIGHLERFERLMERLERRSAIPADCAVSGRINEADYAVCVAKIRPRARTIMRGCSFLAAALWFLSSVYFVLLQVTGP